MKIYTRGGDTGETSLLAGERVRKDAPLVEAYGTVDELNALLGVVVALTAADSWLATVLQDLQKDLFAVAAMLAGAGNPATLSRLPASAQHSLSEERLRQLEALIDQAMQEAPELRSFVLPGGILIAAQLHFARTVCRRAERRITGLEQTLVETSVRRYVNRLSDLLFALARRSNARANATESTPW